MNFEKPRENTTEKQEDKKQQSWNESLKSLDGVADRLGWPIDEGAKEAVVSLMVNGFPTYSSCEGHLEKRHGKTIKLSPYVGVGFEKPDIRFEGEKKIKDRIAAKFEISPEEIQKNDLARKEYWDYIMRNDVSETEEFIDVRKKNEGLQKLAGSLLSEFYKEKKPEEGYAVVIKKIGPAGRFYITMEKNGSEIRYVEDEEMEEVGQELQKEKEEFSRFTQFMKDRHFNPQEAVVEEELDKNAIAEENLAKLTEIREKLRLKSEEEKMRYAERVVAVAHKETDSSKKEEERMLSVLDNRLAKNPWKKEGSLNFELLDEEDNPSFCSIDYDSGIGKEFEEQLSYLASPYRPPESRIDRAKIRRIENILIEGKNGKLEIKELCPEYSIYYHQKESKGGRPDVGVDLKAKYIMTDLDPASVRGIFVLLHEIGHIKINEKQQEKELSAEDQKAETLLRERNASAFALEKLKPFLDKSTMKALRKFGVHAGVKAHGENMGLSVQKKPSWFKKILKIFGK